MRTIMLLTIITLMTMAIAKSSEMDADKRNPGTDKIDYSMCEDKLSWFEKEWCEIVEFQKVGFEQSKKDLAKTKEDLSNLPANTINYVKEVPTDVEIFIRDTGTGVSNWAAKEWHSIKEYQKETWSK